MQILRGRRHVVRKVVRTGEYAGGLHSSLGIYRLDREHYMVIVINIVTNQFLII